MLFPYSIRWMPVRSDTLPADTPVQVITNTSKKKFHHAVDRNRVKRLTRECYRLHKNELYAFLQDNDAAIVLSLNYIHTSILKYETLYHKFDKLIPRLMEEIAYQLSGDHATDVEHTM